MQIYASANYFIKAINSPEVKLYMLIHSPQAGLSVVSAKT